MNGQAGEEEVGDSVYLTTKTRGVRLLHSQLLEITRIILWLTLYCRLCTFVSRTVLKGVKPYGSPLCLIIHMQQIAYCSQLIKCNFEFLLSKSRLQDGALFGALFGSVKEGRVMLFNFPSISATGIKSSEFSQYRF